MTFSVRIRRMNVVSFAAELKGLDSWGKVFFSFAGEEWAITLSSLVSSTSGEPECTCKVCVIFSGAEGTPEGKLSGSSSIGI